MAKDKRSRRLYRELTPGVGALAQRAADLRIMKKEIKATLADLRTVLLCKDETAMRKAHAVLLDLLWSAIYPETLTEPNAATEPNADGIPF